MIEEMQKMVEEENKELNSWRHLLLKTSTVPMLLSVFGVFLMVMAFLNKYGKEIVESLVARIQVSSLEAIFMDYVFIFGFVILILGVFLNRLIKK